MLRSTIYGIRWTARTLRHALIDVSKNARELTLAWPQFQGFNVAFLVTDVSLPGRLQVQSAGLHQELCKMMHCTPYTPPLTVTPRDPPSWKIPQHLHNGKMREGFCGSRIFSMNWGVGVGVVDVGGYLGFLFFLFKLSLRADLRKPTIAATAGSASSTAHEKRRKNMMVVVITMIIIKWFKPIVKR